MLQRLAIRNYALIDNLDIAFDSKLNILTGETGAGKSIIMGALSLILGQRVESKYFFNQQKKCVIEGTFAISGFKLNEFFVENDLDYDQETVLRREIASDGKSRAFINDTPVNLGTLKKLGERLIDIHSQHATLEINDEDFQLFVVDTVAENSRLLTAYQSTYKTYKQLKATLNELIQKTEKSRSDLDYFQFQFDELDQVGLSANEQLELEDEQDRLSHAEEIKRSLLIALAALSESELSVNNQIKDALNHLATAAKHQSSVETLNKRLETCFIELKDIISEVELIERNSFVDENRLSEINERLDLIYSLQKKHRVSSIEELLAVRDDFSEKLNQILFADDDILKLQKELESCESNLIDLASELSASRQTHIPQIEDKILATLIEIGMPNARIEVKQEDIGPNFTVYGTDKIQFFFSANKGQATMPLNKVASGGELSRLMLAVKSLVAIHTSLPTIVFDEIDTGISGETALKVGTIMEKLSNSMQVLAITHLPQIASKGKSHFKVFKDEKANATVTNILKLSDEERITEIAVMLSGNNPGQSAMQNASDLLGLF